MGRGRVANPNSPAWQRRNISPGATARQRRAIINRQLRANQRAAAGARAGGRRAR